MLAPSKTDVHHVHAIPLALIMDLANSPASAVPSLVQPRQLNSPSHVIHSTRPAMPHSGPPHVMPATSAYAHATPVVLEYTHPKTLLCNDYPEDRGFTWVASAKSDDAHRYTVYFWARGWPGGPRSPCLMPSDALLHVGP